MISQISGLSQRQSVFSIAGGDFFAAKKRTAVHMSPTEAAAAWDLIPKPNKNENGMGVHMDRTLPVTLPSQMRIDILFSEKNLLHNRMPIPCQKRNHIVPNAVYAFPVFYRV